MSTTMRAKLCVGSVENFGASEKLRMHAVGPKNGYPSDGSDEDNTYAKYSPSATFEIHIANPSLLGKFKAGDRFYVDFTPVPEGA